MSISFFCNKRRGRDNYKTNPEGSINRARTRNSKQPTKTEHNMFRHWQLYAAAYASRPADPEAGYQTVPFLHKRDFMRRLHKCLSSTDSTQQTVRDMGLLLDIRCQSETELFHASFYSLPAVSSLPPLHSPFFVRKGTSPGTSKGV